MSTLTFEPVASYVVSSSSPMSVRLYYGSDTAQAFSTVLYCTPEYNVLFTVHT